MIHEHPLDALTRAAQDDAWPDLTAVAEPKRPRLMPGLYIGRSARLETFELRGWGRRLILWFQIFAGNPLEGAADVLADLPMYLRLPPGRRVTIRAGSKLGKVFDLLGASDPRRDPRRRPDRLPLSVLKHRLWRVEVRDVPTDARGRTLHASQVYSIVGDVVEHLA